MKYVEKHGKALPSLAVLTRQQCWQAAQYAQSQADHRARLATRLVAAVDGLGGRLDGARDRLVPATWDSQVAAQRSDELTVLAGQLAEVEESVNALSAHLLREADQFSIDASYWRQQYDAVAEAHTGGGPR